MAFLEWSQGCVCIWALEPQVPHAGNSTWRRTPDGVYGCGPAHALWPQFSHL